MLRTCHVDDDLPDMPMAEIASLMTTPSCLHVILIIILYGRTQTDHDLPCLTAVLRIIFSSSQDACLLARQIDECFCRDASKHAVSVACADLDLGRSCTLAARNR
jgi:hypothetical protein